MNLIDTPSLITETREKHVLKIAKASRRYDYLKKIHQEFFHTETKSQINFRMQYRFLCKLTKFSQQMEMAKNII